MRPLILLLLAGGLFGQPAPPPPAILKGSPPGGIGAHCTAPSLTGYLNSSGVLILCPSGTSVWTAQSSGGGSPFATLGVTVAPQLGSIFEVKDPTALNPLTDSQGYAPLSLNVFKRANHSWNLTSTDYSTDISDGLNIYQLLGGTVGFDVGFGTHSTHPVAMNFDPVLGNFSFGAHAHTFFNFDGTGISQTQTLNLNSFTDPDGGGTGQSELEIFQDSVADITSGQTGSGASYGSYSRAGVLHSGYRIGTNAIYGTSGTVFTSNGFTLFDYANNENIWLASTIRPHSFQLGDDISLIAPHYAAAGNNCLYVDASGVMQGTGQPCAAAPGLVLLEQHAASTSNSLDFTSISSTYDEYVIEIANVLPTTNAQAIWLRIKTAGGFDSGSNYAWAALRNNSAGSATAGSNSAAQFDLCASDTQVNTAASGGVSATYRLYNGNPGTWSPRIVGQTGYNNGGAQTQVLASLTGQYTPTTAITGFQVLSSSGTLASGNVRLYGVSK